MKPLLRASLSPLASRSAFERLSFREDVRGQEPTPQIDLHSIF